MLFRSGLGSGIAGIAGVALSQIDNVSPNLGQSYIIDSFMVVVFGGVGNLWGTLVGAFTLGIANKFLEPVAGALAAQRRVDAGDEARVEVSAIKFFAAKVLEDVIDRAVQVHGARGLTDETPLANMLMLARGGRIYDGPDEVHRQVVAKRILKAFAKGEEWHFA